ncbi:helix-turn-helix domain-containing protein [Paenibacillus massiliensis]|uniref:helix-turn-helix domain-containing protein n=1 Tax=Paenibacillus massiliensis TaxID=225917 RepID=UPI0003FADCC7|nr:helix-turn-helix transcriptional regulator [Paenibacillus massiliensis]
MEVGNRLRSLIASYLEQTNCSLQEFSRRCGLNKGTLSAILRYQIPKPLSLKELDRITEAMGHPEGELYPMYLEECVVDNKWKLSRLKPYLLQCARMGRLDCIQSALPAVLDELGHIPVIFAVGEQLYQEGYHKESAPFFEAVAESEQYQHAERLARSHYRLFMLQLSDDYEMNLRAAIRFDPFRNRLPEEEQPDAMLQLINVYFTLNRLDRVHELANELSNYTYTMYTYECKNKPYNEEERTTKYPLVVYYGYAYLMKAAACDKQKKYHEAKQYTQYYTDLSWFKGLGEMGKAEVRKFSIWAKANGFAYELMTGNTSVLPAYIAYIEHNEDEVLPALEKIMEAANRYSLDVSSILDQFEDRISTYIDSQQASSSYYNMHFTLERFANFCYELSYYYYQQQNFDLAVKYVLQSLSSSIKMGDKAGFIKCVTLFEEFRRHTRVENQRSYENMIRGVRKNAENEMLFVTYA